MDFFQKNRINIIPQEIVGAYETYMTNDKKYVEKYSVLVERKEQYVKEIYESNLKNKSVVSYILNDIKHLKLKIALYQQRIKDVQHDYDNRTVWYRGCCPEWYEFSYRPL